jgi:hypothetical protein
MATSNTKRARGPRKAIITPATLQRAQELITEHREAELALNRFTIAAGSRLSVPVEALGASYTISASGFATLLAQDLVALEREAKRLGVQLKDAPEAPLLGTAHQAEAA